MVSCSCPAPGRRRSGSRLGRCRSRSRPQRSRPHLGHSRPGLRYNHSRPDRSGAGRSRLRSWRSRSRSWHSRARPCRSRRRPRRSRAWPSRSRRRRQRARCRLPVAQVGVCVAIRGAVKAVGACGVAIGVATRSVAVCIVAVQGSAGVPGGREDRGRDPRSRVGLTPVAADGLLGAGALAARPIFLAVPVGRPALGRGRLRPALLARRRPMRRVVTHISIHGPGRRCRLMFGPRVTKR